MNPYAPPAAPIGHPTGALPPERAEELRRLLKGYNTKSFALGVPGLILQFIGRNMGDLTGSLLTLVGIALFIGGLYFYAKMRGQHPAMCLLGVLSCVGMLILYFLPKKCLNCASTASYSSKQCQTCSAPLGS